MGKYSDAISRGNASKSPQDIQRAKNQRSHQRRLFSKDSEQATINERLAKWRKLSPSQQLAELDKRGFAAKRQRARIQSKIDNAK